MTILVFREKRKDRYFLFESSADREKICSFILEERIKHGSWYFGTALNSAKHYLGTGEAYTFLFSRSARPSEEFDEIEPEQWEPNQIKALEQTAG